MPPTREQLYSIKRLLKEARALIGDVQNAFRGTGAARADIDAAERLREIACRLAEEIEYIQRRIDGNA